MNSRIVVTALSAAVMGVACMAPIASQAQTPQASGLAQKPPSSFSEGTSLALPKVDPSKVKKFSGAASAEKTAPKTGDFQLQPVARR